MTVTPGATATRTFTVTDDDTALALGSGDVPVLATPRLVAWCEAATVDAVAAGLEEGATTVGSEVHLEHRAPTPVGAEVTVTATVEAVEGRQVRLAVAAADGSGTAGRGTITRVVVDRQHFVERSAGAAS